MTNGKFCTRFSVGNVAIPLLLLFWALLQTITAVAEVRQVTALEVEDRDFIRYLYQHRYDQLTLEEADAYLRQYPQGAFRAEVHYLVGRTALRLDLPSDALRQFSVLITQYPDSPFFEDALFLAGTLLIQQGQDAEGTRRLERLLVEFHDTEFKGQASYQLGQLAFQRNEWQKAERYLSQALDSGNTTESEKLVANHLLAWSLWLSGNIEAATTAFVSLLNSDLGVADKAKICNQLAIEAYRRQQYRETIHWYQQILTQWPHPNYLNRARFWIAESLFLLHQESPTTIGSEDKKRAIALFTANLNSPNPIEPHNSRYHRGWLYHDLGQIALADDDFSWLQENDTDYAGNYELTTIRAGYYERDENWQKANEIYRLSLEVLSDPNDRNTLQIRRIRNDFRLGDCPALLRNSQHIDLNMIDNKAEEIHFYLGTCHFRAGQWEAAKTSFGKISLQSEFSPVVFESYLATFRRTADLSGGLEYLTRAEHQSTIADRKRILLYKIEFNLELQRWLPAIVAMEQVMSLDTAYQKDAHFLMNTAQTYDRVSSSLDGVEWRWEQSNFQSIEYYRQQALNYYQTAYFLLPKSETQTRRKLLETLIARHEKAGDEREQERFYREAISLTDVGDRKDAIYLKLARLRIKAGDRSEAIQLLSSIHGRGNQAIHFTASSLLAELYIDSKHYDSAIAVLQDVSQQLPASSIHYVDTHFRLGELYQVGEQWQEALEHYNQVLQSIVDSPKKEEAQRRSIAIEQYLQQPQPPSVDTSSDDD
jgi:tetratricopeptide (TPR) repeat protein